MRGEEGWSEGERGGEGGREGWSEGRGRVERGRKGRGGRDEVMVRERVKERGLEGMEWKRGRIPDN